MSNDELSIKEMNMNPDVIRHYDSLIDENHDPVFDPPPLREYMDKWDGEAFLDALALDGTQTVLEIGVGTGRLALRAAPRCKGFYGIDISPKTILRAGENLRELGNVTLWLGDVESFSFGRTFDVVYSSLTFLHIRDKQGVIEKISRCLARDGRFVLSIDKNQDRVLEYGDRRIPIYPDTVEEIGEYALLAGMRIAERRETEFAHILVIVKNADA